jgi:hypothetical protein
LDALPLNEIPHIGRAVANTPPAKPDYRRPAAMMCRHFKEALCKTKVLFDFPTRQKPVIGKSIVFHGTLIGL